MFFIFFFFFKQKTAYEISSRDWSSDVCSSDLHRGNEDCFVSARDANGDVTEWEPHGLDCTVCIDVATEARQMFTSGASVRDIRAAVEKKWAGFNGGHTPTPNPPKAH